MKLTFRNKLAICVSILLVTVPIMTWTMNMHVSIRKSMAEPQMLAEPHSHRMAQFIHIDNNNSKIQRVLNLTHERKIFSQNGEDGIFQEIFGRIGTRDKYYVEFGVENGLQCNTRYLRETQNWRGLLMDGGFSNPAFNLNTEMIFADNIVSLFVKYSVPLAFDLLSIDTDLKDFWIAKAILEAEYKPRVIIAEVNACFSREIAITVPIEHPITKWEGDYFFGSSPAAYFILLRSFNYSMVFCEVKGVNCFWIANSELNDEEIAYFNLRQTMRELIQCAAFGPETNKGCHRQRNAGGHADVWWWTEIIAADVMGKDYEVKNLTMDHNQLNSRRCLKDKQI